MEVKNLEQRKFKAKEVRVDVDPATGEKTLQGYCAVFNSQSVLIGSFYEEISPGAFADSLINNDVRALYNHDDNCVLGRLKSGTLTLEEDNHGLLFTCKLGNRSYERDLAESLERGDIDGCSFGFVCQDERVTDGPDGYPLRRLLKVDLVEVSLGVTFPAYGATTIALRSIERWKQDRKEEIVKPKLFAAKKYLEIF